MITMLRKEYRATMSFNAYTSGGFLKSSNIGIGELDANNDLCHSININGIINKLLPSGDNQKLKIVITITNDDEK